MAVEDTLQVVKDCIAHAKSSQICISSFFSWVNPAEFGNVSFSCGLSNGMTRITNLTKFYINFYLPKQTHGQKSKICPEIGLTSIFEFSAPICIFVPNFRPSSDMEQLGQYMAVKLWTMYLN